MSAHPFWAFVEDMNQQAGPSEPRRRGGDRDADDHHEDYWNNWTRFQPWGYSTYFPPGPLPHRGPRGPPPPPFADQPHNDNDEEHGPPGPPPPPFDEDHPRPPTPPTQPEKAPEEPGHRSPSPSPHRGGPGRHRRHHEDHKRRRCGGRGRGGRHSGPDRHERGPWGQAHHPFRGFGGFGGFGRWGPYGPRGPQNRGGPSDASPINLEGLETYLKQLQEQIPEFVQNLIQQIKERAPGGAAAAAAAADDGSTIVPHTDIFNTAQAYIIHVYLAGAKKSDLDVSFDAGQNAVKITGVIQRPSEVDEEMLKDLLQSEARIGFFEKTVNIDRDAKILADQLSAKLEDGVLRIEIPKDDSEEWTEVKKIAIE